MSSKARRLYRIILMLCIGVFFFEQVMECYWTFVEFILLHLNETEGAYSTMSPMTAAGYQGQDLLPSFPSILPLVYKEVTTRNPQRKMTYVCPPSRCSGIADRIRGLPFVLALALQTNRQLEIHPSILATVDLPSECDIERVYVLYADCRTEDNLRDISRLTKDTSESIFVATMCFNMPKWDSKLALSNYHSSLLKGLYDECSTTVDNAYLCGAGILHEIEILKHLIGEVRRLADSLEAVLPKNNYTTIQIRAGGSQILIDNTTSKALPWSDGYVSEFPQLWVETFRGINASNCKKNIAVVSDSTRIISELRYAVWDKLMITHCCTQPLHREFSSRKGFFFQEVLDLFIMARSKHLIASTGNFATLGRYWLGKNGPNFTLVGSSQAVRATVVDIVQQSECEFTS